MLYQIWIYYGVYYRPFLIRQITCNIFNDKVDGEKPHWRKD